MTARLRQIRELQARARGEFVEHQALTERLAAASTPWSKKGEGFVATPPALAARLVDELAEIADLPTGARVLEPSAGHGPFVHAILAANPGVQVVAIERNRARAGLIPPDPRVQVVVSEFEEHDPGGVHAVVMNPPFSVPGARTIWIDHVRRAWDHLLPGGRLVAIVPLSVEYGASTRHAQLRALLEEHGGWESLGDQAFALTGAPGVSTAAIWMDRPGTLSDVAPERDGEPALF